MTGGGIQLAKDADLTVPVTLHKMQAIRVYMVTHQELESLQVASQGETDAAAFCGITLGVAGSLGGVALGSTNVMVQLIFGGLTPIVLVLTAWFGMKWKRERDRKTNALKTILEAAQGQTLTHELRASN